MRESSTYQAILEEGRQAGALEEAKRLLLLQGTQQLGRPNAQTSAVLKGLDELARIEELMVQLPAMTSWQELLGQPPPRRTSRRRPN